VAFKTVIYAMAVDLFEFGERVVRAWYERGSLREGLATVKANANLDYFLALLILAVDAIYAITVLDSRRAPQIRLIRSLRSNGRKVTKRDTVALKHGVVQLRAAPSS
jgi:hypothetical protein